MSGFYSEMAGIADELLSEFRQGEVRLTRTTYAGGYDPDGPTPPEPEDVVTTTYRLNATVRGVSSKYVDNDLINANDLQIVCAKTAYLIVGGEETGETAEIVPQQTDSIEIDGAGQVVIMTKRIPAAGTVVSTIIFVKGPGQ